MKNSVNIAIIGLGQIGIYLYNELRSKKKKLREKPEKKLLLLLFQQKIRIKNENFKFKKKFSLKNHFKFLRRKK
tara:strand:+ start:352 stop:573 length:222 start_codon:yes stop_codon:yes gene_type:complete